MKTLVMEALSAKHGGGQTYVRSLLEHFRPREGVRLVALLPPDLARTLRGDVAAEIMTPAFPASGPAQRAIWSRSGLRRLLRQLRTDVLFCPGGYLSAEGAGIRTALTFQNMLPFAPVERRRFPLGYHRTRFWLLEQLQRSSIRRSDLVVCISEFARHVVEQQLPDRHGQIAVIRHGIDPHFTVAAPSASPLPFEYVLYVSILNYYKAQIEVVEAWAQMRKARATPEKLVLAGFAGSPYARHVRERIAQLGLTDEVKLVGDIPHRDLPAWYRNAKVNLFASSCENCPFILLEAMAAGRPTLSSNYEPMPELAGTGADYFDPYNPPQLARLLQRCLDDEALRMDLGARASAQSRNFNWERAATATWDLLIAL